MNLKSMIGFKLFKEREDGTSHILRITKVKTRGKENEITVYDEEEETYNIVAPSALSDYSPLKPDGILMSAIVTVKDNEGKDRRDIIVSAAKYLNIEYKLSVMPYAVCRQSISDIFYAAMYGLEETDMVGLAVNEETCPKGFDFGLMFAADSVDYKEVVNFYRMDTLNDIYELLTMHRYNDVLESLYREHVKSINKPEMLFKNECDGWCKDLKTLLSINNFQSDIDQMLGITSVKFNVPENCIEKTAKDNEDIKYLVAADDFREWISKTYRINVKEANIIEFGHDINLGDFNNTSYLLLRDDTNKLYLVVYISDGEYLESDLIDEEKEKVNKFQLMFNTKKYS